MSRYTSLTIVVVVVLSLVIAAFPASRSGAQGVLSVDDSGVVETSGPVVIGGSCLAERGDVVISTQSFQNFGSVASCRGGSWLTSVDFGPHRSSGGAEVHVAQGSDEVTAWFTFDSESPEVVTFERDKPLKTTSAELSWKIVFSAPISPPLTSDFYAEVDGVEILSVVQLADTEYLISATVPSDFEGGVALTARSQSILSLSGLPLLTDFMSQIYVRRLELETEVSPSTAPALLTTTVESSSSIVADPASVTSITSPSTTSTLPPRILSERQDDSLQGERAAQPPAEGKVAEQRGSGISLWLLTASVLVLACCFAAVVLKSKPSQ